MNYNVTMNTWIYKGSRKPDTYVYLTAEDDFSQLPEAILSLMGEMQFVLEVDLAKRDKLAQADINSVRESLQSQGFYIQLPPGDKEPEKVC